MKKISKWMFAAILLCGLVTTSCSKDDDDSGKTTPEPTPAAKTATTVDVKAYAVLADDMLELFDVVVNFQGPTSSTSNKSLEKTTWIGGESIEKISSSAIFTFSVKVTPKAGVTVDTAKDYKLGLARSLAYVIQDASKNTIATDGGKPDVAVTGVPGSKLTEDKIKQLAETYTMLGDEIKLEVYKDNYIVNGYKYNY